MTNPARTCFLFNPSSNGGKAAKQREKLKSAVMKAWRGAAWVETEQHELFWETMESRSKEFDLLVACGGDGTVHKTGNITANQGCVLGVIPLGSGNDFAKMNGIPASIDLALELLNNRHIKEVDLIRCSGDLNCWCLNTLGVGLDGLANKYAHIYKSRFGRSGYIFGALKGVLKSEPFIVRLGIDNEKEMSARLLMLTSCIGFREGGRFIVAPNAVNNDGRLVLLSLFSMNIFSRLVALPQFLFWFPSYLKKVKSSDCKKLTVQTEKPVAVHADGEYEDTLVRRLIIEVHQKKLKLVALKK